MGGIEFVKSIRDVKEYKLAPIIMVSTESEVDIILEAISHGANDYVLKPAEPDVLKQKIEKALKR
jgi:two-component system chemotaxis response regulator CheY